MRPPPSTRPRIRVTRQLPAPVEARLDELFEVHRNPLDDPLTSAALGQAMCEADGLLVTVTDRIDAALLATTPRRVGIVANFGVGYNHIDLVAAAANGIVVTNTPGVLTDDTADLAMMLMLMVARRAGEGERHLRSGAWTGWRPTHMMGTRLTGATLGIVGMGRIGRAVARRAVAGFGMQVCYYQPNPVDADAVPATRCDSLDDLVSSSDVVSIHCPATPQTLGMFDQRVLGLMRPGAILINTARGDIVDEAALAAAVAQGRLAGAGLDVYRDEPVVHPALLALEQVVLLPHLGSATLQSRVAMGMCAIDNLVAFFAGLPPPNVVFAVPG